MVKDYLKSLFWFKVIPEDPLSKKFLWIEGIRFFIMYAFISSFYVRVPFGDINAVLDNTAIKSYIFFNVVFFICAVMLCYNNYVCVNKHKKLLNTYKDDYINILREGLNNYTLRYHRRENWEWFEQELEKRYGRRP